MILACTYSLGLCLSPSVKHRGCKSFLRAWEQATLLATKMSSYTTLQDLSSIVSEDAPGESQQEPTASPASPTRRCRLENWSEEATLELISAHKEESAAPAEPGERVDMFYQRIQARLREKGYQERTVKALREKWKTLTMMYRQASRCNLQATMCTSNSSRDAGTSTPGMQGDCQAPQAEVAGGIYPRRSRPSRQVERLVPELTVAMSFLANHIVGRFSSARTSLTRSMASLGQGTPRILLALTTLVYPTPLLLQSRRHQAPVRPSTVKMPPPPPPMRRQGERGRGILPWINPSNCCRKEIS